MSGNTRSDRATVHPFTSWRDFTPMNISLGTMLHNRTGSWRFLKPFYEDKTPACQNACPAGNDIEGWVRLLQQEDLAGAYWHLKREEPFPAILGRICFRFCQDACNRSGLDACVNVQALERFVAENGPAEALHPDQAPDNGKRLAVVGSGPAGMSAAYFARLLGFDVTVFEAATELGGVLAAGIPAYRLPRDVVAREFEGLRRMGIAFQTNAPLGDSAALTKLMAEFDYVFLATGCHESIPLPLEKNVATDRIMSGLSMLGRVARGEDPGLGRTVVVIGGGNTAIDAARTAVRLGCDVTVLYRRGREEMPAHPEEVEEAMAEGVAFRFLAAPRAVETDAEGRVVRLVCDDMELGEPDESGRRRPVPKAGNGFALTPDSIITAIGERAGLEYLSGVIATCGSDVVVDAFQRVSIESNTPALVFAGGDMTDSPRTVIHAVAAGKRAAIVMDCFRQDKNPEAVLAGIATGTGAAVSFGRYIGKTPASPVRQNPGKVVSSDAVVYDHFRKQPPVLPEVRRIEVRRRDFSPVIEGFDRDRALEEAARCMHCGRCTECDNCLIFCPDVSVLKAENGAFGYDIDYDYCKGCGICAAECPRQAITMVEEDTAIPPKEA